MCWVRSCRFLAQGSLLLCVDGSANLIDLRLYVLNHPIAGRILCEQVGPLRLKSHEGRTAGETAAPSWALARAASQGGVCVVICEAKGDSADGWAW